jgi:hypothetical protein
VKDDEGSVLGIGKVMPEGSFLFGVEEGDLEIGLIGRLRSKRATKDRSAAGSRCE